MKNIYINANAKIAEDKTLICSSINDSEISAVGFLINNEFIDSEEKSYYGSDFSGYYYSWRTGKIGLKALDGIGTFQGEVNEETLQNMGFEKKTV